MTAETAPNPRRIYLSPHYDDVAFSLGTLVAAHPGGTLVNVFTRTAYLAASGTGATVTPELIERAGRIRDAEDMAFASACGLTQIALGAEEPMLRGREPFDRSGHDDDCEQIRLSLPACLDALVAEGGPVKIFCPAGIGGHVNHLATRSVALAWHGDSVPGVTLCFYEDLPYASRPRSRLRGIRDLRDAADGRPLRRRRWKVGSGKLEQVRLYASQHRSPVENLRRFSPATLWPFGPHEAVWELLA